MASLRFPQRPAKPRSSGKTYILDSGRDRVSLRSLLDLSSDFVDMAKIGWGTSLVLNDLPERIALYGAYDIPVCFGGTLFEYAFATDQLDTFADWLAELGIGRMEVSDGTLNITASQKAKAIEKFAERFYVLSEVGSKDSAAVVSPARWVAAIRAESEAGASEIILEGREGGTAGLYRANGEMRTGLVDEIIESGISPGSLIFEAPNKTSQSYLITTIGTEVNLANIKPSDAVPLETLRLGLRSDTLMALLPKDVERRQGARDRRSDAVNSE